MSGVLRRRPGVNPGPPEGHFGGPEGYFGSHFGVRNRRNSEGRFRSRFWAIFWSSKKIIFERAPRAGEMHGLEGRQIQSGERMAAEAGASGGVGGGKIQNSFELLS